MREVARRPDWADVVCVASGPSFSEAQAEQVIAARALDRCRVIVINDNWRRVPNADLLWACDGKWWQVHHIAVQLGFPGELWTQDPEVSERFGLNRIKVDTMGVGLSRNRGWLHGGGNGGYQSVNLACHLGARNIILVGYDFQPAGGKHHWFGNHPAPLHNKIPYDGWVRRFRALAEDVAALGIRMVNCSPSSALTFVQSSTLDKEFGDGV